MRLLEPNSDIEEEKDLTLFIQKYLQAYNPPTILKCGIEDWHQRRSFSDLKELYLNYNPEVIVSYDDMIKCLLDVKFQLSTTHIAFRYCGTPRKVVIFATDQAMPFDNWTLVCKDIYYWHCREWFDFPGIDGLTDKYVIELLKTEFNNKNK